MHKTETSNIHRLAAVLLLVVSAGCGQLSEVLAPSAPGEWAVLLKEIRALEHRIGFADTRNFADLAKGQKAYSFCGYAPRLTLPYSYEDSAIQWLNSVTSRECNKRGRDADIYYGAVEAWGEVGTPVTAAMAAGKLHRFIYLVIHEDCHDQFGLPYGIEEALCNLITFKAMELFADEKYPPSSREYEAIRNYVTSEVKATHATVDYYNRLAGLYARFERGEITQDALLRQRTEIMREAQSPLGWGWMQGQLNNVVMANHMTYSRHYPLLESVHQSLGNDLARTVAFFRRVDKAKPPVKEFAMQRRIANEKSAEFLRAYETAVMDMMRKALLDVAARRL